MCTIQKYTTLLTYKGVWKFIILPLFRRWFIDVGLKGYA